MVPDARGFKVGATYGAIVDAVVTGRVKLVEATGIVYPEYVAMLPTASTQYEVLDHRLPQVLLI
jgi:hypothetical protein